MSEPRQLIRFEGEQELFDNALSCPFCGHKPSDIMDFVYPIHRSDDLYKASCTNPDCSASVLARSPKEAYEEWNKRPSEIQENSKPKKPIKCKL